MPKSARILVYLVFAYTCIEGYVINVTYPSKAAFIYKDILLVMAYAGAFMATQGQSYGVLKRMTLPLVTFGLVQVLYLGVPSDLSLMGGLVAIKQRLLYIPAMFLAYRFAEEEEDVRRIVRLLALTAIPVALFGIYLFFAGSDALRAMGGQYSAIVISTTGFWRVPGTFNSPGQYGGYLMFNAFVLLGLLLMPGEDRRMRLLLWAALAVLVVALFASGSRSPLVILVGSAGLLLMGLKRVGRVVGWGIIGYLIFMVGFMFLGPGVQERVGSIASYEHIERFNRTWFGQLFIPQMLENPMGLGLGVATIGARHFTELGQVILMESYLGIVAVETGLLGLFVFLWLAITVGSLVGGRGIMVDAPASPLWHTFIIYVGTVLMVLPISTPLDAAPVNLYFWFSAGLAARLYDLERWRRYQAWQAEAEQAGPLDPFGRPIGAPA